MFASDLRTVRQLDELKQLMAVLWVSSSDVIIISTKQAKDRTATMLSPSFLTLVGATPPDISPTTAGNTNSEGDNSTQGDMRQSLALVLETYHGKVEAAYYIDTSALSGNSDPDCIYHHHHQQHHSSQKNCNAREDVNDNAVQQALRIINAARTTQTYDQQDEPLRALSIVHCNHLIKKVMCEIKVSRHTEHTTVAVVRDVTERYRRFEAESRVHAETIARQRDMHTANRFTRHEVKNGLLSGIELCRTLGQSLEELKTMLINSKVIDQADQAAQESVTGVIKRSLDLLSNKSMLSLVDLDGALHGVLDTVLAEVMAREVVHEVYQPRLEELDVPTMLVAGLGMKRERTPLTVGTNMPRLLLDAQLIRHIHRNAVSNACKYGKQGAVVKTFVEFNASTQEFKMEVTNEPGLGHDMLLAMGESAGEFVFAQGVRLQPHMKGKTEQKLDSSGDGAWIMQKCAKTMNGVCQICFAREGTKFTFRCPAAPVALNSQPKHIGFVVPKNVRAIGVDDSKIQRKLLARILTHVGVESSKQLLLGESPEDVTEFDSTLMTLMEEHPTDKFLVIVDEHLVSI